MEAPRPHTNSSDDAHAAVRTETESAASALQDEKASLLANHDATFDVTRASRDDVGTIVTDKRRKRQSLFGVIKDAATEWTEEKAETVKGMEVFQKPTIPKVTPGAERKEIIEKAVETPRAQAQDDHKLVMERIKTFQQDAERVTGRPFIMKKESSGGPTWSHVIGDNTPEKTMPSSGRQFPQVQHIHREDVTSQAHTQAVAPTVSTRTEMPLPQASTQTPPPEKTAPVPPVPTLQPPVSKPQPPVPHEDRTGDETSRTQTAAANAARAAAERQPAAPRAETPAPTFHASSGFGRIVVAVSLLLIVCAGIGGGAYYFFVLREPVVAGVVIPSFLKTDAREALELPNERLMLLEQLSDAIAESSAEFLHVYFVFENDAETETLATTGDIFGVLTPRVGNAFVRSLDERMMLGGVQSGGMQPFMLLKSNAFDTAFAGMLEWETFMSADLAPLFGEPVARSFNPDARTADRTTRFAFTDRVVANHNVRMLYDESGNERITYGFVNRNTIILTTTSAAFEKLLNALQ